MKTLFLFLLMLVFNLSLNAQESVEADSYFSNNTVLKSYGLPIVRSVYGGTKLLVDYQGNWTNDMKGAFEYACKIWEEAMPTTFPIRICAILDEDRESSSLSRFSFNTRSHTTDSYSYSPFTNKSTWTQIKGTTYHELSGLSDTRIYEDIISEDMFMEPDITLTYYNKDNKLVNNCSFSLNETPLNNYYDFVSVVLRDLAKSFGLHWNIKANGNQFRLNVNNITPYEQCILDNIREYNDAHQTYLNALKGSVTISGNSQQSWTVYAPNTWNSKLSLNYFIPNNNQKITQLLSFNFGKGSIVRDISSYDTYTIFRDILHWKGDVAIGLGGVNSYNSTSASTGNVVSYKGTINVRNIASKNSRMLDNLKLTSNNSLKKSTRSFNKSQNNITSLINKYHPNYNSDGSITKEGWVVALLLEDGTWDIVSSIGAHILPYSVSTSEFILHHPAEDYARSCDGYLRCRVTESYYNPSYHKITGNSHYYLLDYLPQCVKMKKSKVLKCEDESSYYRDVNIALKDLEGTTKIIVSQLDEGNDLPYSYEVKDFKKGYFTATVDKDFTSTFTIIAYNKNGSTTSYPYVLNPVSPTPIQMNFTLNNNVIHIQSETRFAYNENLVSNYSIQDLTLCPNARNTNFKSSFYNQGGNNIDISSLKSGFYLLTVCDTKGNIHTFKFAK